MNDLEDLKGAALPPKTVVVERGPVVNFATAVTDDDPAHHDVAAATQAGFDAIPAPPTWPFVMDQWGAFPEIQPEGAEEPHPLGTIVGELMSSGGLILHGEQEFTFTRPIVVGDVLTGRGTVRDIYVKEAEGRPTMTFVVTATTWSDDDGDVATSVFTLIHRAAPADTGSQPDVSPTESG